MAQIFNVQCPACAGSFPVHPELWQAPYDLLCPFCGATFPQEQSPLIVTGAGERRPGREVGAYRAAASTPATPAGSATSASAGSAPSPGAPAPSRAPSGDEDPSSGAESM